MKIGIIRCMQTEDYCPGTSDFKAIREHTGAFADVKENIEIVGFTIAEDARRKSLCCGRVSWSSGAPMCLHPAFKRVILSGIHAHLRRK